MERDNEKPVGPDLTLIRQIVSSSFIDAGFRRLDAKTKTARFDDAYSGGGMVWVVQVLQTFAEFVRMWDPPSEMEDKVVAAFTQIANAEERWNLSLLIVIPQPLIESYIHVVSKFQEDPSSFARFVLPIETERIEEELKHKIAVLLMNWMSESTTPHLQDVSVETDIENLIQDVASERHLGKFASLSTAMRSRGLTEDGLLTALLQDLRRQEQNET